jgi:uncharacterized protein YjdB
MAMKTCPTCGEKYSDSYKHCPFCEEEENLRASGNKKRKGGHRVSTSRGPSFLSPVLIILIILMAGVMVYLLFGDQLVEKLHLTDVPGISASSSSETAKSSASASKSGADKSTAAKSDSSDGADSASSDVKNLPETLSLSLKDFTMNVGDAPVKITASGGSGSFTWSSDNKDVATVDKNGNVTAVASGSANIYASDGNGKGVCIVRVKGSGTPNKGGSTEKAALSTTDATVKTGESFALKVTGGSSDVKWSVEDSSIATVDGSGKVKGVAAGKTNVTAEVDGEKLVCVVRVR